MAVTVDQLPAVEDRHRRLQRQGEGQGWDRGLNLPGFHAGSVAGVSASRAEMC